jgi:hypothetical protein
MELFQSILVYITLAIAIGYIVKKFFLPKALFISKKSSITSGQENTKACGQNDCGCH